jgi:uncharacterized protein YcbK (DUF882 family)
MSWTRRRVLQVGGTLAGGILAGVSGKVSAESGDAAGSRDAARRDCPSASPCENIHTDEKVDVEFYRGDGYVPEALASIQKVLRDWRNNDQHPIDPKLMDYLYDVAHTIGVEPAFSVISGYRSPETNAQLHERSSGVSSHSLHMEGRAIDVRLAGVNCADLAQHALDMQRGGVGYYRQSDFVHLDTGRILRTWKRLSADVRNGSGDVSGSELCKNTSTSAARPAASS